MPTKIYLGLSGGCYQGARNVPSGYNVEVLDWDNLLGDEEDTTKEWDRLDAEAKQFVKANYPQEYRLIQKRLYRSR
jgi:hypothetical protein